MKKFLKHTLLYGLILFILANSIAWASLYFLRHSNFYKPSFVANNTDAKLDYIVLGSSTGLTTLDTKLIDSITGMKGLNMSMDDTSLPSHYLMLRHYLKQGGSVSKCILVFNAVQMNQLKPELSSNDYRFLPYVNQDYVSDYYREMNSERLSLSAYVPAIGVGYYNAELFFPGLVSFIRPNKTNRFDTHGNYSYPDNGTAPLSRETTTLSFTLQNSYYERIKTLCAEKGIELVLYHPPLYATKVKALTKPSELFINHSDLLTSKYDFYDNLHLNSKGRDKATKAFIQSLRN